MLDKGRISSLQLCFMLYPTVLATGFLVLPTIGAQYAQNDLWLTGILASFMGMLSVYVAVQLHRLYPKQTVIECCRSIIGTIPGKLLGLVYFMYFMQSTGNITRQYAEFVRGNFLMKTPVLIIIITLVVLCAIAVRGGAELIARSAVIFTSIFILPLFILLLSLPDMDVKNLFPVLSHGIIPVLKGTATPQGWIAELFMMTFFLPCLTDPEKGMKYGMVTVWATVVSMVYVNLIVLFLFGVDAANKTYPILTAFRYMSLSNFFENMESILLAMWVAGNFVKISVFFYAGVFSYAQALELSDYRPVVFPIGVLIVVCSLWDLPDSAVFNEFLRLVPPFEIPTIFVFIPLILLIIGAIRQKKPGST